MSSSSVKIVENVKNVTNGKQVPVMEFVRKYPDLAAALSKAIPGTEPVTRDGVGNRKISPPDLSSMISMHRNVSRRNKDAEMTLKMLPDLKLALEMVVTLIMSPKDMFNDDVVILSDSSDLLPASIISSMLKTTTDYYRKNHNLSQFLQHMLMECLGTQGALPTAIIPENTLDNLINNYNENLTLESFKEHFDTDKNLPRPLQLLGVPDYLTGESAKADGLKTGSKVKFDLQSFDQKRSMNAIKATTSNAGIMFSKLLPKENETGWKFKTSPDGKDGEEVDADEMVFVTDNISVLKLPELKRVSLENRVSDAMSKAGLNKFQASLESMQQKFRSKALDLTRNANGERPVTDAEVEGLIFKNRRLAYTPVASLRTNTQLMRNSIGEAMIKIFDTACFMPVSVVGDPTRKLGGIVLLDEEGNPLTTHNSTPDELIDLTAYAGGSGNFISSMNDRSNSIMNGKDCSGVGAYALKKYFTRAFGEIVEKDVIDRIKNGQYDQGAQLGTNDDFFWLMLTRLMKGQRTQVLWIPAEFLVYFAMDYDELGFGKSLLDDIRNLTSMRIMLMVAGINASLRNSIGRTKVTVKLDEEDPDAEKTIEDIQDEILKSRMNPIPFGINNVADISKYLQRSCYEFEISGSSALPDMQIAFEQFNSNYPKPDEDLQNYLKNLTIEHFGLTKDMIDAADGVEFAIQAATSNAMTMKRVQRWQRIVVPQASDYIRKVSFNSEEQLNAYRDILEKNFDQMQVNKLKKFFGIEDERILQDPDFKKLVIEQAIGEFIGHLYIEFPSPATTTLETQKTAFDEQVEFYKAALDYYLNESFFDTSIQGEGLSDHVDMIKNIILSHYMREYMANNGILPELSDLTTIGEDGKVAMDIMASLEMHIKALGMSTQNFFARFKDFSIKQTGLMQNVAEGSTEGETDSGSGGEASGGGFDEGGGDDSSLFGGDGEEDFDMPDDEEEESSSSTEEETSTASEEPSGDNP